MVYFFVYFRVLSLDIRVSRAESEGTVGEDPDGPRYQNRNARKVCRPPGRPRGSLYLPWDSPIITWPVLPGAQVFRNASAYAKAANGIFLPSVGTNVIARMWSACGRFVVGWHASGNVNVVSPKHNASDIAIENVHAARDFVKQQKHPARPLRRLRSRRVVTQQNEFQNLFATVPVVMPPRVHRVVPRVGTVVIAAAP